MQSRFRWVYKLHNYAVYALGTLLMIMTPALGLPAGGDYDHRMSATRSDIRRSSWSRAESPPWADRD
jgi:hypothetical protein